MLLTGVLIFIAPHTATQAAMACIFAFVSLVGFEILRPHMDPADSWLYRLVSRNVDRIPYVRTRYILWDDRVPVAVFG